MNENYFDYSSYGFDNYTAVFMQRKTHEKKELNMLGKCTGLGICAYFLLSEIFALIPYSLGLQELYSENGILFYSFTILSSLICMLAPFYLISRLIKKKLSYSIDLIPVNKPKKMTDMLLAIPAGFGGCLLANIITTYIDAVIQSSGAQLSSPNVNPEQTDVFTFIMCLACIAVCAPVCEEIVMRGIITQPLRKYGTAFAIGAGSTVFGLLHCNLVQAPCAIMAGIVLAYLVIVTESIWTSIIIHIFNNLVSIVFSQLQNSVSERDLLALDYLITIGGIVLGVVCFIILFYRNRKSSLTISSTVLTTGEKIKAYFVNVPMILALIFILIITSSYVSV